MKKRIKGRDGKTDAIGVIRKNDAKRIESGKVRVLTPSIKLW